ncbi:MAG: hypothetical protein A2W00_04630 [Candidatus Eisenbacteria bacterium RBG_16_71_46]|nr:MAG: hypothetical protein A2W00_04630 [Candidatus Eisenbacteria bacterium RBG_16_71_46]
MRQMDEKLANLGGLRPVVKGMDRREMPYQQIADELERLTGVRVHPVTIRNWLIYWQIQEAAEEAAEEVTAA